MSNLVKPREPDLLNGLSIYKIIHSRAYLVAILFTDITLSDRKIGAGRRTVRYTGRVPCPQICARTRRTCLGFDRHAGYVWRGLTVGSLVECWPLNQEAALVPEPKIWRRRG